jgi:hypothetical protein
MQELRVFREVKLTTMDGNGSMTVSWPKLMEVNIDICTVNDEIYLAKLIFGSAVLRISVQQLSCNLHLLSLGLYLFPGGGPRSGNHYYLSLAAVPAKQRVFECAVLTIIM